MSRVIADMSMSLDGFIEDGDGGVGDLFGWYDNGPVITETANTGVTFRTTHASAQRMRDSMRQVGALIVGRRLFDLAKGWGGCHPMDVPVFVVTHHPPGDWQFPDAPFTFVTDGVTSAVRQASEAAGDKLVAVASASVTQQCLDAGLLDEIHLNLVPVLLGHGVRWFDQLANTPVRVDNPTIIEGDGVTHLVYPIHKPASLAALPEREPTCPT